MFINDGYTCCSRVGAFVFHYRPFLTRERQQLFTAAFAYADQEATSLVTSRMAKHIVRSAKPCLSSDRLRSLAKQKPTLFGDILSVLIGLRGEWRWKDEQTDAMNLQVGIRLQKLYPELASRDCVLCQRYMCDETGHWYRRRGEMQERPESHPAPCRGRIGCVKGTPESPRTLNARNVEAYRHYRECVAIGRFPDDAIVRQNAMFIRETLHQMNDERDEDRHRDLVQSNWETA